MVRCDNIGFGLPVDGDGSYVMPRAMAPRDVEKQAARGLLRPDCPPLVDGAALGSGSPSHHWRGDGGGGAEFWCGTSPVIMVGGGRRNGHG